MSWTTAVELRARLQHLWERGEWLRSLVDGTDAPGWPVQIVMRRRTEFVWGALRLLGSTLYVPIASS